MRHYWVITIALLVGSATGASAQLTVLSTTPQRQAVAAAAASVSVTFDRALNTSTVNASTFRVFGRVSGTKSGALAFTNGNATVTLTPSRPFAAGETVLVNLSHAIGAADASPLRSAGYAFAFRVAAQPAGRTFQQIASMSNRGATPQTRIYGAMSADLDGDGYADLTTVNEVSADLRVFMNRADGSGLFNSFLTPPLPIGLESSPNEPADFDNDGHTDIGVSSVDDASEWIALGNGDGTFAPAQEVLVGTEPHGIAVLDVDGDADLDIVNANFGSNDLSLMLNNGSGVFGAATFFDSGGGGEYALNSADMNNDGITDLVVGLRDNQTIVVLLGNGNGTFSAGGVQNAGGWAWKLVTGDVDGDHNADVAVVNGESGTGAILLGDGSGGLGAPRVVSGLGHLVGSALGDLDGDGDLDWVVSSFGAGRWTVFTNNGAGVFGFDQELLAPNNPSCAIIVDLDNDGDLDLALTDEIADVVLLMRNGPLSPLACPPAPSGGCRRPVLGGKALLKLKDATPDSGDKLLWKWIKGADTSTMELGDPVTTDDYTLCLYDNGALVGSSTAPHGSTWVAQTTGYQFKDGSSAAFGAQKVQLRAGSDGAAKMLFRGRGANLDMPDVGSLTGPIDVRLIRSGGAVCWGAAYSAPFLKNDGVTLKDKAD